MRRWFLERLVKQKEDEKKGRENKKILLKGKGENRDKKREDRRKRQMGKRDSATTGP